MGPKDVVLEIGKIILRYFPVPDFAVEQFAATLAEVRDEERLKQLLMECRQILDEPGTDADRVYDVVNHVVSASGVQGFQAGIYIGYITSYSEDPMYAPYLPVIVAECKQIIDTHLASA
jgi:hypothetical protein